MISQFIDWHILYIQSKRIPCSWKRTVILDLHKVLVNDEAGKLTVSVNYAFRDGYGHFTLGNFTKFFTGSISILY